MDVTSLDKAMRSGVFRLTSRADMCEPAPLSTKDAAFDKFRDFCLGDSVMAKTLEGGEKHSDL